MVAASLTVVPALMWSSISCCSSDQTLFGVDEIGFALQSPGSSKPLRTSSSRSVHSGFEGRDAIVTKASKNQLLFYLGQEFANVGMKLAWICVGQLKLVQRKHCLQAFRRLHPSGAMKEDLRIISLIRLGG